MIRRLRWISDVDKWCLDNGDDSSVRPLSGGVGRSSSVSEDESSKATVVMTRFLGVEVSVICARELISPLELSVRDELSVDGDSRGEEDSEPVPSSGITNRSEEPPLMPLRCLSFSELTLSSGFARSRFFPCTCSLRRRL